VSSDRDGSLPALDLRFDASHLDGCTKDGAIKHGTDGAIGALPHLLEAVFLHAGGVGGDGRAFDGDAQAFGGLGGIDRDLVICLVAVLEAEVVVLGPEVDVGA